MKRILHILKKKEDSYPLELIQRQAESNDVVVILIQDAVGMEIPLGRTSVLVLFEGRKDSKVSPNPSHTRISNKEVLETIFACDTVVTW